MSTDTSTTGDDEPEPADSDADPEQMPEHGDAQTSVDGVAEDDTDPGSDPDGDSREMTSS